MTTAPPEARLALGRAVRELRRDRGVSQEELALTTGLQRKTIHQLERGKTDPRYGTLRRVAQALELTVVDVVAAAEEGLSPASGVDQDRRQ